MVMGNCIFIKPWVNITAMPQNDAKKNDHCDNAHNCHKRRNCLGHTAERFLPTAHRQCVNYDKKCGNIYKHQPENTVLKQDRPKTGTVHTSPIRPCKRI